LFDLSVHARQLPLEGIAEKLAGRFGIAELVLCWRTDGDDRPHCARVRQGALQTAELPSEEIEAMLEPEADGRTFLWDSSSGSALVEHRSHTMPVFRHIAQPSVPEILLSAGARICGMPIKSGSIAGYIYLLGMPRISETVLARAVQACEAVNATLDRYQLFEAWRDRAFANARLALSRDMHDSVLQTLAGLRMQVAALIKEGEAVSAEARNQRLSQLQSIIAAEQACLRELLVDSDEAVGEKIDLAGHLAQRIELLSRQWGILCNLDVADKAIWVASDVAIEVEFLVREAVSNAVQHAKATNITVIVALRDNSLFITLRSNGSAESQFKMDMANPPDMIASRSLTRRLEALRGRAYADPIESGALLSMRIPVEFGADV
jgi:signal transduction histidine kinase